MPYTPPSQMSPAASKPSSPSVSRSHSYIKGQFLTPELPASSGRTNLPRSHGSSSYLTKHRRSPSLNDKHEVVHNGEAYGEGGSFDPHGSLRKSPPPVTNSLIPAGMTISPPDSSHNSSDDEEHHSRGRSRNFELGDNLKELQAAIRSIEQRKSGSPTRSNDQQKTVNLLLSKSTPLPSNHQQTPPGLLCHRKHVRSLILDRPPIRISFSSHLKFTPLPSHSTTIAIPVIVTPPTPTALQWYERSLANWFVQHFEHPPDDGRRVCRAPLPTRKLFILTLTLNMYGTFYKLIDHLPSVQVPLPSRPTKVKVNFPSGPTNPAHALAHLLMSGKCVLQISPPTQIGEGHSPFSSSECSSHRTTRISLVPLPFKIWRSTKPSLPASHSTTGRRHQKSLVIITPMFVVSIPTDLIASTSVSG